MTAGLLTLFVMARFDSTGTRASISTTADRLMTVESWRNKEIIIRTSLKIKQPEEPTAYLELRTGDVVSPTAVDSGRGKLDICAQPGDGRDRPGGGK